MYLKALQLLNERQWIRYHADGTNYEYVNQMSGHKLASEFSFLTRSIRLCVVRRVCNNPLNSLI